MKPGLIAIVAGTFLLSLSAAAGPDRIDVERAIQDIDTAHPGLKSAVATLERRRGEMNRICALSQAQGQQCRAEHASNPDYCTCTYHQGLVSSSITEVENSSQSTTVTVSRARGLVDQIEDGAVRAELMSQFGSAKARADSEIGVAEAFVDAARQDRNNHATR